MALSVGGRSASLHMQYGNLASASLNTERYDLAESMKVYICNMAIWQVRLLIRSDMILLKV